MEATLRLWKKQTPTAPGAQGIGDRMREWRPMDRERDRVSDTAQLETNSSVRQLQPFQAGLPTQSLAPRILRTLPGHCKRPDVFIQS
jgi:hypothetical protein